VVGFWVPVGDKSFFALVIFSRGPSFKPRRETTAAKRKRRQFWGLFVAAGSCEAEWKEAKAPKDQDLRIEILHRFDVDIPFSKLTWQWKITIFNREYRNTIFNLAPFSSQPC